MPQITRRLTRALAATALLAHGLLVSGIYRRGGSV